MDYECTNHSKYLLMYHLILVCKYRKKTLTQYGNYVKSCFTNIAKNSDFNILEMEVDEDHIHMLIKSCPSISVLQIVMKLKQMSTVEL